MEAPTDNCKVHLGFVVLCAHDISHAAHVSVREDQGVDRLAGRCAPFFPIIGEFSFRVLV